MKNNNASIFLIGALCCAGLSAATDEKSSIASDKHKSHILMEINFDESINAKISKGKPQAIGNAALTDSSSGKTGRAAVLSPKPNKYSFVPSMGNIKYEAKDNLKAEAGTIEFDIKPLDWESISGSKKITIFEYINPGRKRLQFYFEMTKDNKRTPIWLWVNDLKTGEYCNIKSEAKLKDDEWHHVAICWDKNKYYLNIDEISGSCKKTVDLAPVGGNIILGGYYFTGLFDNFKITDICANKENNDADKQ